MELEIPGQHALEFLGMGEPLQAPWPVNWSCAEMVVALGGLQ
jgi:hypothetical protein